MNFLFVDRIIQFEPSLSARGLKHVTFSDPYLKVNKKGQAVLPSCIVGEALGQLTAWIVMQGCHFEQRPVAGMAEEVRIYRDVLVGETLELNTKIESLDSQAVLYNSHATVCGEMVFSMNRALGPLLPMRDFIEPESARQQFNMIYRLGELSSGANAAPMLSLFSSDRWMPSIPFFDDILELNDQKLVARKKISLLAPYFADHFPKKPVLPLTLLLEGKLALVECFLREKLGAEKVADFLPIILRRIKMKAFIAPGDCILTTLELREERADGFLFAFKTQLDGKTICSLEAFFEGALSPEKS